MTNKKLYRDTNNAKLGGICAGIAHYFECETWLIRLITFSLFLFSLGTWVIVAYIALYFILEVTPQKFSERKNFSSTYQMKNSAWQSGQSAQQILEKIEQDLNKSEKRIEQLESYATSFRFSMHQKFNTNHTK